MARNKRIDDDTRPVLITLESSYKLLVDNSSVGTKMLDLSVVKNVDNHVDGTTNKVFTATEKNKLADLATVAETGSYNDLLNLPTLFSGSYLDLTDVPTSYSPSIIEQDTNNRFVTDAEKTTWDNKLDLTGGIIDGNLIINGDVSVSGSSFIVNAQTVEVKDNLLVINNGEPGAGVTNGISGIEVDRGTSIDYQFVFEESSNLFKIGEIGDLQRVATFTTDSIPDGYFTYFNSAENGLSAKQIDYLTDLINVPAEFTPESHTHTLSEVTDSGTAASKDYWTGTQAEFDSNTVKDGIAAQSADIAIIIG